MISVHFQGKPFSLIVIQVYAPTCNAEEAEVERFYEHLQNLLVTPKKYVIFIIGDWNANKFHVVRKLSLLILQCLVLSACLWNE